MIYKKNTSTLVKVNLLLLFLSTIAFSCGKDKSEDPSPDNARDGEIVAVAGSNTFRAPSATAALTATGIIINGFSNTNNKVSSIAIGLIANKIGTYTIGSNSSLHLATYNVTTGSSTIMYASISDKAQGQVVLEAIDTINNTISGSFNFILGSQSNETINISKGVFSKIPYADEYFEPYLDTKITAKVDGATAFSPHFTSFYRTGFETIAINGTHDGQGIFFTIPSEIAEGIYNFNGDRYRGNYNISSVSYDFTGGTIVISQHDKTNKKIKGTFQFSGLKYGTSSTVSITEGIFEGRYY